MEGLERVMIVTDESMVKLGFAQRIIDQLQHRKNKVAYEVFAGVEPNPDISTVRRRLEIMNSFKPNAIVALGGGSSMDAGTEGAEKFQDIARMLGLKADTPEEAVDSYAQAVFELGKRVGTPMSFKDHGVDYDKFKAALKTLALDSYEDQCTPANPRLALLKDLEGIMEAAWHGFDKKKYEENK